LAVTRSPVQWRAAGTATVYRRNGVDVYPKSTGIGPAMKYPRGVGGMSSYRAYYHQQYLAKNPNGYCGIGGCGVPFKLAELPVGEKA
jgi:hypothetical protein